MAFNNVPINGWPQISADNIPFSADDFNAVNVKDAILEASSGGGGGGTTVVANPEGSATADLTKLQVGETIYGIPAEAGDISYDNTTSGMTADDLQEAIDELNTGLGGINALIPSDATTSNKLATANDIPGVATTLAPGIVQPDGTSITIVDGVISAAGGSSGETYSATETVIGTWLGQTLYRKVIDTGTLPNNSEKRVADGITGNIQVVHLFGVAFKPTTGEVRPLPFASDDLNYVINVKYLGNTGTDAHEISLYSKSNYTDFTTSYIVFEYIKLT